MIRLLTSLCLFAVLILSAAQARAASDGIYGVWRNPKGSVHVDIRPCGASACGYVVWASPKAQDKAKRGSGKDLIGLQLLRDFSPSDDGWRGKVFVPDLNITLSGTARLIDPDHLDAQGCLLGLVCKHQIWTRMTAG